MTLMVSVITDTRHSDLRKFAQKFAFETCQSRLKMLKVYEKFYQGFILVMLENVRIFFFCERTEEKETFNILSF